MTPALDGVLVADFSRVLAGPYATMLLADLGAVVGLGARRQVAAEHDAVRELERACELNANDPQAQQSLGAIYRQKKEFGKAIAHLEQAILLDPKDAGSLSNLSVAHIDSGNVTWSLGAFSVTGKRFGLTGLSMGMSGDFEAAIAHGATHVRVGSALFGARNYT